MINCTPATTLDSFVSSLLIPNAPQPPPPRTPSPLKSRADSYFHPHPRGSLKPLSPIIPNTSPNPAAPAPSFSIPEVVLARDLDRAPKAVQIQVLELLRTRRIFTRTAVQAAPRTFMFVPVIGAKSGGAARVTPHLNDFFFLAHWHDVEDGFPYLEEEEGWGDGSETASTGSVVRRSTADLNSRLDNDPLLSEGVRPHALCC